MAAKKLLVGVAIFTLIQALPHFFITVLGVFQWFCLIDLLSFSTTTIFINAVYFHSPQSCGVRLFIGPHIDGLPNQASLVIQTEAYTSIKTLMTSCIGFSLAVLWIVASGALLLGGAENSKSIHARWPWMVITSLFVILDVVNAVMYFDDHRHTSNFDDLLNYIDGVASGFGAFADEIDTYWVSIVMALVYSRFLIFSFVNLFLLTAILFESKSDTNRIHAATSVSGEINRHHTTTFINMTPTQYTVDNQVEIQDRLVSPSTSTQSSQISCRLTDESYPVMTIPRPEFSYRPLIHLFATKLNKGVLQPIEEEDANVVSPSDNTTTGEQSGVQKGLANHLPWAYIKPSGQPMRTILRPEEDLPPVPLQDYTVTDPQRKFSVHRAGTLSNAPAAPREAAVSREESANPEKWDVLY